MGNSDCTQENFGFLGFKSEGKPFPLSQIAILFSKFATFLRRKSTISSFCVSFLVVVLIDPFFSFDFGKSNGGMIEGSTKEL